MAGPRQPGLSFDTLEAFIDNQYGPDPAMASLALTLDHVERRCTDGFIARQGGVDRATIYRWRKANRVPLFQGDAFAQHGLGIHPMYIWGVEYFTDLGVDHEHHDILDAPRPERHGATQQPAGHQ